ncbi:response regulator [Gemmatimonadota bacterium]
MDKPKILVVEDTPANMELVTDLLEIAGYEVIGVETAEEGVQIARTEKPSLIIMDIHLPGMDGLGATRILKEDPDTKGIPIIIATSSVMTGDEPLAWEAGCDGYVSKPIDTRAFPGIVAGFLNTE